MAEIMKNWYVINTKPKKEFQVERLFQEGGLEVYSPKYRQEKSGCGKPIFIWTHQISSWHW